MKEFAIRHLLTDQERVGKAYMEILRVPALSMGLYALSAGATDWQEPHAEDEVYLVLQGRAQFQAGEEDHPIESGTLLFVPAHLPHRFHDITEDLKLLVFFAPAESLG